jgi:hypothetical protein
VFACVVVTAVQCPPPENPNNGKAIYTSCSYNSVVSYECKYGYTLVGEPTRRCGADKRWSGVMPQCKGELQSYLLLQNCLDCVCEHIYACHYIPFTEEFQPDKCLLCSL